MLSCYMAIFVFWNQIRGFWSTCQTRGKWDKALEGLAREGMLISWHQLGFMRCLHYDCHVDGNQQPQAAEVFAL